MADFSFQPAQLQVAAGATVIWSNGGVAPHTVTSTAGAPPGSAFDSGIVGPGGTYGHRFDQPGTYPYLCTLHPQMTGVIQVVAAAGSPDGAADGTPLADTAPAPPTSGGGGAAGMDGRATVPVPSPAVQAPPQIGAASTASSRSGISGAIGLVLVIAALWAGLQIVRDVARRAEPIDAPAEPRTR